MPYSYTSSSSSSFQLKKTSLISRFKHSNQKPLSLLLQSCKSTEHLKQIHAQILRTNRITDTFIATKLLESFAISARNINYAVRIFDCIHEPNTYTWTTMIRGFVEAKIPKKAIEFYSLMRWVGVEPGKFTYLFVLKAYSLVPSYQEGRIVHGKLVKLGFYFDPFVRNALIHLYSIYGDVKLAFRLFKEVGTNNVVNWNTMMTGFVSSGDIKRAQELFDEIPERNVESWNVLIIGYLKCGLVDVAGYLFDEMPERDLFSWSSMISSYVQSRRAMEALNLFKKMQNSGVKPDSVTMASVLSACAQIGAVDMGRWIHAYVGKNKLEHDVVLGTALVDMYAKCGYIDTALQIFHGMAYKNVCSWNAILCGLAMHGHGAGALDLFKQMESTNIKPDDVSFVAILCACGHIGSVDISRWHFERMEREYGITPKIEHYGSMVDILGRAGQIEEAKELIKTMPMELNVVVLGALLSACKIHGVTDIGDDAVCNLQRLNPGDGGCYILLSNLYAAKGQWDKVTKLRKKMRSLGFEKKIPGCSSIEVYSVVHEFLVEDRSHPEWKEVFEVIDRVSIHLEDEGYAPNPSLILYNIDE